MSFKSNIGKWLTFLFLVPLLGVVSIALYCGSVSGVGTAATAILVASGAWVVGALLGFIFAVPQSSGAVPGSLANSDATAPLIYHSNANLEQISDWLTKILVGVSLVEVTKIVAEIGKLVAFLAPALGNRPSSSAFALALLVVYSVSGFMAIYLVTRVFLTVLFARTEQSLNIREAVQEAVSGAVPQAVQETQQEQDASDAHALGLALRQLDPEPGVTSPSQDDLNTAVGQASQSMRIQIFQLARAQRSACWNDSSLRPKVELTIPVFRALIAADSEERFHRNHAQLGYALKDKLQPDYAEAEKELSRAIAIRDRHEQKGFLLYEFARAVCRIKLGEPRERIVADLSMAAKSTYLRQWLERGKDSDLAAWMKADGLTVQGLVNEATAESEGQ